VTKINLSTDGNGPQEGGTDQERESGVVDDRPMKRARVEDEDALDDEEEDQSTPQVAPQASDLYLDTVRHSCSTSSTRVLMRTFYR
jgi:hypothetical protein